MRFAVKIYLFFLIHNKDDKFKESYLATIGVDFVLNLYEILYLKRGSRQLK